MQVLGTALVRVQYFGPTYVKKHKREKNLLGIVMGNPLALCNMEIIEVWVQLYIYDPFIPNFGIFRL